MTRSHNQFPNFESTIEIKSIDEYKRSVVISDDMLEVRNSFQKNEFSTRGRLECLNVFYISQSYFGLPRQSFRNERDRKILFKQTFRDVESMYKVIGGYGMRFDEFSEMCRKVWSEKFNYLCIDVRQNKKIKVKIVNSMRVKTHNMNASAKV